MDPNDYSCKACRMIGCLMCDSANNCVECHAGFYIAVVGGYNVCKRCS